MFQRERDLAEVVKSPPVLERNLVEKFRKHMFFDRLAPEEMFDALFTPILGYKTTKSYFKLKSEVILLFFIHFKLHLKFNLTHKRHSSAPKILKLHRIL